MDDDAVAIHVPVNTQTPSISAENTEGISANLPTAYLPEIQQRARAWFIVAPLSVCIHLVSTPQAIPSLSNGREKKGLIALVL